jgi:sugar/nucleoside kinase (ribokinase family)
LPKAAPLKNARRAVFVDIADPEKRTTDDLSAALKLLTAFQKSADVVLGVNLKEAEEVAAALAVPVAADPEAEVESLATKIRGTLQIYGVVIHPRTSAAVCWFHDGSVSSSRFSGPKVVDPKILTGGGDHFNAGFCLGWLAGLSTDEALCAGTATSGYYVANAASPTLHQLIDFIASVPEPAE